MFGKYLHGVCEKIKAQIRVGACTLLWVIWNTHNNVIFNKTRNPSFSGYYHWISTWWYRQPEELQPVMDFVWNQLGLVVLDLYNLFGWLPVSRIA
jgi:hypothetical protein